MKTLLTITYFPFAIFLGMITLFSCSNTQFDKKGVKELWDNFKIEGLNNADVGFFLSESYKEKYLEYVNEALTLPKDSFWAKPVLDQYRILYIRNKMDKMENQIGIYNFNSLISEFGFLDVKFENNVELDTILFIEKDTAYGQFLNGNIERSVLFKYSESGWKMDFFSELPRHIEQQEALITRRMQLYGSIESYFANLFRANFQSEALFNPIHLE